MVGPFLSILLMGMIPVWNMHDSAVSMPARLGVVPPSSADRATLSALDGILTASGAIIVDLDSAQTVYARNTHTARPMASLTKLMTALIIAEHQRLDEYVAIPPEVTQVVGTKAWLIPGERFRIGDLLSALLIESANDAAYTLAVHHSGSTEAFVEEMNDRAQALGLLHTSYKNPSGLDETQQESSPRDLAWLAMYVMNIPAIAERMGTPYAEIISASGKKLALSHTHQLLHPDDGGESADLHEQAVVAGKTGTTDAAGQCLLSIVEANGRRYIAILLHSRDRYADMRKVLATLIQ